MTGRTAGVARNTVTRSAAGDGNAHGEEGDAGLPAAIVTEDFLAVPYLIAGTERAGLLPERVARLLASVHGLTQVPAPFHLADLLESLWWHSMHARGPAHGWLRRVISEAGRLVEQSS